MSVRMVSVNSAVPVVEEANRCPERPEASILLVLIFFKLSDIYLFPI